MIDVVECKRLRYQGGEVGRRGEYHILSIVFLRPGQGWVSCGICGVMARGLASDFQIMCAYPYSR